MFIYLPFNDWLLAVRPFVPNVKKRWTEIPGKCLEVLLLLKHFYWNPLYNYESNELFRADRPHMEEYVSNWQTKSWQLIDWIFNRFLYEWRDSRKYPNFVFNWNKFLFAFDICRPFSGRVAKRLVSYVFSPHHHIFTAHPIYGHKVCIPLLWIASRPECFPHIFNIIAEPIG